MSVVSRLIDEALFAWLKLRRRRTLRGIDTGRPVRLMTQYRESTGHDPTRVSRLAAEILGLENEERWPLIVGDFESLREELSAQLGVFSGQPYQLGALDLEIDVVAAVICNLKMPRVLEIGIANGYSSAFLFLAVHGSGGSITAIDRPRFSDSLGWPGHVRRRLTARGRIRNTGTLGDLNPGGVIPADRYVGWLVPESMREAVPNRLFIGDALSVLPTLDAGTYHACVLDAMKPYSERMECFSRIDRCLTDNGICFVDGYWVNSAFADFTASCRYPTWEFGRVGAFRKV